MALAVTLKASGVVDETTAGSTPASEVLSAITFAAGSLVVVALGHIKDSGVQTHNIFRASASGLTFSEETGASSSTGDTAAIRWLSAPHSAGGSTTITIDSNSQNVYGIFYLIYEVTGHDTGNPIGAIAAAAQSATLDGAYSITLDAAPASSSIVLAAITADSDAGTNTVDPGSGWTEDADVDSTASFFGFMQGQRRTGSTSTNVAWADIKAGASPTLFSTAAAAIEIIEGAAVGYAPGDTLLLEDGSGSYLLEDNSGGFQLEPMSAQSVNVGQPSTTDTAQPAARTKARTPSQPATTDTALTPTRTKRRTVGQPATTDTALTPTRSKRRTVGQPSTTDTAQPVLVRPIKVYVGQASTTDTPIAPTRNKSRTPTQPSTTDSPQPVTRTKRRTPTQPSTTDSPLAPARSKARTTGQPSTTDLAQPATRRKFRSIGQPSTVDTALAVSIAGTLRVNVGQPSTVDSVIAPARLKRRTVTQPSTTDSPQPALRRKSRTPSQPFAVDEALTPARLKRKATGLPSTADAAIAATRRKTRILSQPSTVDLAQRVYRPISVHVGQPFTVDVALAVQNILAEVPELTGRLAEPRLTGSVGGRRLSGYIQTTTIQGGL